MKLFDKHNIRIEYVRGAYKKFVDSLEEYPILGVTFPTHYGYIIGYESEDGHDLDIFLGSGNTHGAIRVNRGDVPGGIETKIILCVTEAEFEQIRKAYQEVIYELKAMSEDEIMIYIEHFKANK